MIATTAKYLQLLVNTPDSNSRLQTYADYRVEILKEQLTGEKDPRRITEIQGAIRELRRIDTLRDEVNRAAEEGKKE